MPCCGTYDKPYDPLPSYNPLVSYTSLTPPFQVPISTTELWHVRHLDAISHDLARAS